MLSKGSRWGCSKGFFGFLVVPAERCGIIYQYFKQFLVETFLLCSFQYQYSIKLLQKTIENRIYATVNIALLHSQNSTVGEAKHPRLLSLRYCLSVTASCDIVLLHTVCHCMTWCSVALVTTQLYTYISPISVVLGCSGSLSIHRSSAHRDKWTMQVQA